MTADGELHIRGGGSLDLAFILDGRPLLRALRIQAAAQLLAGQVCKFDLIDVVGLYPALVLCIRSLVGYVGQVIVVLVLLAVGRDRLAVSANTHLEFSRSHVLPGR